ncbi:MAG: PAS domain-containing protein [Methylotenera sp.]|nr:PAS domain-containing protein [Methylotenera sp.]
MSIFIFSGLIISIIFLIVLGSWYNIQGPLLLHIVILISTAVAIFSVAIIIAMQPLLSKKSLRTRRDRDQEAEWGREVSVTLSSPAAMLDGYIVKFINTPFLQILGMAGMADQIIGMPFTNLVHPANHQDFAKLNAKAAIGKANNEPTRICLVCADGTICPSNVSLTRISEDSQNNLTLFQFTPISTISLPSNDYESQFNYHSIIDSLDEIVFQLSAEGKIIFLNPSWERMLEYKAKSCLDKSLIDFFHPEDKPLLEAKLNALTQGKRSNCTIEARLLSARGDSNWIVLQAKTTSTYIGERTGVIGTMTNIQSKKEIEAGLIASRRAANSLLSNIPGMVYRGRNDHFWTFEFVSDGCIDITGYDPQDFINNPNLNFNLIIHPDDRAAVWESVNQQISINEKFKLIYRIVTRTGETKLVQEHGQGIFSSTGELLALEGFITEIPDQCYNVTSAYNLYHKENSN